MATTTFTWVGGATASSQAATDAMLNGLVGAFGWNLLTGPTYSAGPPATDTATYTEGSAGTSFTAGQTMTVTIECDTADITSIAALRSYVTEALGMGTDPADAPLKFRAVPSAVGPSGVSDGDYGDITVSGGGTAWAVDPDAVTNAKLANMAQATVKGRASGAGTGDPADLTAAQLWAIIKSEVLGSIYPVGTILPSTDSVNPGDASRLNFGTWAAFGAGRVLVGLDSGDTDFDTAEETGGAKTKAVSAHAGATVNDHAAHVHSGSADHASHTHTYTEIVNHTHPITSQTATTGSATSYEHGVLDTSSADAEATEVTGTPAGGVATGTTNGPGAALTHGNTGNPTATITHTVGQASAHSDLNVVQPYQVVYYWRRTA